MAAALTKAGLTAAALRRGMARLPVRFDSIGFWPRAALGLVLRAWALAGAWPILQQGLTASVAAIYRALGGAVVLAGPTTLLADRHMVEITISCTQVEVALLLLPFAIDFRRRFSQELAFVVGLLALTAATAIGRLLMALALYHHGVGWALAHDVPLGIAYAGLFIAVLRRNAWEGDGPLWRHLYREAGR